MHWKRLIISFAVAVFISLIILSVSNDFGITWDEPLYMHDGDQYVAWLQRPIYTDKDKFFEATVADAHPPLRKLLSSLTHEFLTTELKIVNNTDGYRISALLFVFPFVTFLTYIAIGEFGYTVGILIPFMFSFLPHVFFLTPLVTLDYAIAVLWFVAVMTGVKGMKSYFWLVISGICVGLTMLTKLHGYLLFVPIGGYWFWYHWKRFTANAWLKVVVFTVLAIAVYILLWPWLWTNTIPHLIEYFRIQAIHGGIPEYIFGRTYVFAPWWYTPVMFITTTPAFVLIFSAIGSYWALRRGKIMDKVILVNALYPIVFFSLPGVYRYDFVRLFLPTFPFVCLLAGRGIVVTTSLFKKYLRIIVFVLIIAAWVVTLYASVIRIHPFESAYYNEFVGGIAGAHNMGMESEFWGNSYVGVLGWMNDHKGNMMCVPFTLSAVNYYQAMGQIQPGVVFDAGRNVCDYMIVLMRQGFIAGDPFIAKTVRTQKPVYTVSVDGVALVGVYDISHRKN